MRKPEEVGLAGTLNSLLIRLLAGYFIAYLSFLPFIHNLRQKRKRFGSKSVLPEKRLWWCELADQHFSSTLLSTISSTFRHLVRADWFDDFRLDVLWTREGYPVHSANDWDGPGWHRKVRCYA